MFAFAMQIYFDFSGYSDISIGCARMLGFVFPENFNMPYLATSVTDFWHRWHMTLSTWLRDYLYIPLGGSRHGTLATLLNLMVTMLLGGLWHGAQWTFVAWGGFHGVALCIERLTGIGHERNVAARRDRRGSHRGDVRDRAPGLGAVPRADVRRRSTSIEPCWRAVAERRCWPAGRRYWPRASLHSARSACCWIAAALRPAGCSFDRWHRRVRWPACC